MRPRRHTACGRARAALVFGQGDGAVALLTFGVARVMTGAPNSRIAFTGPARFETETENHIANVILPTVDRITESLGLGRLAFEVSIANPGAASATDKATTVTGFSADLPVFLALLSAALDMPVAPDLVSTGHIASPDGDVAAVRALPGKLQAAMADPSIERVLIPNVENDSSMTVLRPAEKEAIADAVIRAKRRLQIIPVTHLVECVREAFSEEAAVLAGLRKGFFGRGPESGEYDACAGSPMDQVAAWLLQDNEARFWRVIERSLLSEAITSAKRLLAARARYHIQRNEYPATFGEQLRSLVWSLPPSALQRKNFSPLLPPALCLGMMRNATDGDFADARMLLTTVDGGSFPRARTIPSSDKASPEHGACTVEAILDTVLSKLSADHLAAKIGIPVDTARACYTIPDILAPSYEQYLDIIIAFHLHLLRHCRGASSPEKPEAAEAGALKLVEDAFANRGGALAARAESVCGTRGGLRMILDAMSDQFKRQEIEDYVNLVLKESLDPLDFEKRRAFMKAFLEKLSPHLPAEVLGQPPERYLKYFDALVRAYVDSIEKVNQILRTL